ALGVLAGRHENRFAHAHETYLDHGSLAGARVAKIDAGIGSLGGGPELALGHVPSMEDSGAVQYRRHRTGEVAREKFAGEQEGGGRTRGANFLEGANRGHD